VPHGEPERKRKAAKLAITTFEHAQRKGPPDMETFSKKISFKIKILKTNFVTA
jgi:hypothetical protein